MDLERRALLDHAARCRRVADGIKHAKAAERLRFMAQEYEVRAGRSTDDEHGYRGGIRRVDRGRLEACPVALRRQTVPAGYESAETANPMGGFPPAGPGGRESRRRGLDVWQRLWFRTLRPD